jgi:hypothetical protein
MTPSLKRKLKPNTKNTFLPIGKNALNGGTTQNLANKHRKADFLMDSLHIEEHAQQNLLPQKNA